MVGHRSWFGRVCQYIRCAPQILKTRTRARLVRVKFHNFSLPRLYIIEKLFDSSRWWGEELPILILWKVNQRLYLLWLQVHLDRQRQFYYQQLIQLIGTKCNYHSKTQISRYFLTLSLITDKTIIFTVSSILNQLGTALLCTYVLLAIQNQH